MFSPVQGESYKMGSDESMSAAHLEYSDRKQPEFNSLPSPPCQVREVGGCQQPLVIMVVI